MLTNQDIAYMKANPDAVPSGLLRETLISLGCIQDNVPRDMGEYILYYDLTNADWLEKFYLI